MHNLRAKFEERMYFSNSFYLVVLQICSQVLRFKISLGFWKIICTPLDTKNRNGLQVEVMYTGFPVKKKTFWLFYHSNGHNFLSIDIYCFSFNKLWFLYHLGCFPKKLFNFQPGVLDIGTYVKILYRTIDGLMFIH